MMSTEGLDPQLAAIVQRIIDESKGKVKISSGRRTTAQQAELYRKYKAGKGNLAAKPGHSKHESGHAVDFGGDLRLAGRLAKKYGLVNSVPGEPWHFTLGGGGAGAGASPQPGSETTEFAYNPGEGVDPQEALANRLHAIMRILGNDPSTDSPNASSPSFGDPTLDEMFSPGIGVSPTGQFKDQEMVKMGEGIKRKYQDYARQQLSQMGWDESEMNSLITLWNKESGWDPIAQNENSTAFGIAQFLNGTWAGTGIAKTDDPFQQIDAGLRYIKGRYGSPSKALAFHRKKNWY